MKIPLYSLKCVIIILRLGLFVWFQARPWYGRFLESYRLMSGVTGERCDCGAKSSDFAKFEPLFEHYASTELIPLLELAPCVSRILIVTIIFWSQGKSNCFNETDGIEHIAFL